MSNTLLAFFMVFLLTIHFFQMVVLTFPIQKMIERGVGHEIHYVPLPQIPVHVRQVFSVPYDYSPSLPVQSESPFDKALLKSFELRRDKLFSQADEAEFYLNTLSFGGDVVGLEDAADYYYSKPVNELSFEEALTLLSFQKVFMK